jgi:carbon-monoxide dehydrogenase large subunit
MGEGGAIGSPPAIINAVADAIGHLGATLTRQPLTPPVVMAAMRAAAAEEAPAGVAALA